MRPILLTGHTRPLSQVKYNRDGDLIFSVSKDSEVNIWFSANGERLGTFTDHNGAVWSVDISPNTVFAVTGAADNTVRLWDVKNGKQIKVWNFPTVVKRVEFSPDGSRLLAVSENIMGYKSMISVLEVRYGDNGIDFPEQIDEPSLRITCAESKATAAGWGPFGKYIIATHANGSVSQFDSTTGEARLSYTQVHDLEQPITDLQFGPLDQEGHTDRSYFITASKDKTSKIISSRDFQILKTYPTDTPLNTAAVTAAKDFVIVGGGQAAVDVTTTSSREGKFEARFYHKILGDEIGRVPGHFGPINYVAVHPRGQGFATGGEDGYVRIHHFDKPYFDFMYEVEREQLRARPPVAAAM